LLDSNQVMGNCNLVRRICVNQSKEYCIQTRQSTQLVHEFGVVLVLRSQ
jgi:hypothetical protein